jgi:RNA polymerase sigma-70 factor (ECF subfamily)
VQPTDADLVERAKNGSEDAARELVRRYQRPLFNLIIRMIRDPGTAEDLAQDAFVKAFSHLRSYEPGYKFSSWIFRIAHNVTIDYLRRPHLVTASLDDDGEGNRGMPEPQADGPSPQALAEGREMAGVVERAIEALRPEYREAIVLRFQEELSYEEIAEIVGKPLGTVKSDIHRARAELAKAIRQAVG